MEWAHAVPAQARGLLARAEMRVLLALMLALAAGATPARALETPQLRTEVLATGERLEFTFDPALAQASLAPETTIEHGVLVARFPQQVALDTDAILSAFPDAVALARLDRDGSTLRLALKTERRPHVSRSFNVVALDLLRPEAPDPDEIDSPMAEAQRAAEAEARRRAALARREPAVLPLNVRTAEASEYSRIVFEWTSPVGFTSTQEDGRFRIAFDRDAAPRLTDVRINPPRGLTGASADRDGGRLTVTLDVADGFGARAWSDGARVVVDVADAALINSSEADELAALAELGAVLGDDAAGAGSPSPFSELQSAPQGAAPAPSDDPPTSPPAPASEHAQDQAGEGHAAPVDTSVVDEPHDPGSQPHGPEHAALEAEPAEPSYDYSSGADPRPASGVVVAEVTPIGSALHAAFRWMSPVAAAVFRRGDVVWVVFDAEVDLDVEELTNGGARQVRSADALRGPGYSAVRIETLSTLQAMAVADGSRWVLVLSEAIDTPPQTISLSRDGDGGRPGRLVAELQGAVAVRAVADPDAGDVLQVALATGPVQGLPDRRDFVGVSALATAHGLAFEVSADDLRARVDGDRVIIEREDGLLLTPRTTSGVSPSSATATPGFVDFVGWSVPASAFIAAQDDLVRQAALSDTPAEDTLALARFLVAHELGAEALGVLRALESRDPLYAKDGRVRALSGAANIMVGRDEAARTDFNAAPLARDPAASLWRGYLASRARDWREARRQFDAGQEALFLFRPDWRARFLIAQSDAALALNDMAGARRALAAALAEETPDPVRLAAEMSSARLAMATGDAQTAMTKAGEVARGGYEPLEVAALRLEAQAALSLGLLSNAEARERMEELRFRWRGDSTEFDIARELGRLYVSQGDIRGGLQLMNAAVTRFPDTPAARETADEMAALFRSLYLDGEASALDPILALALWYEFAELTPIGADGDLMIRRLVDRLVDFDLLDQAGELLQHQVDNRLRGAAKAQVATDLAAIYLMNARPEDALRTIQSSRVARLPEEMTAQRRLIEARALAELGRADHALELIERDQSPLARLARADIVWGMQDWSRAGPILEDAAGAAWRSDVPLTGREEQAVLRAALAYNMAGEADRLARLAERFGEKMRRSSQAAAWRVVTAADGGDSMRVKDLARSLQAIETLEEFLDDFRGERGAPLTEPVPEPEPEPETSG